MELLYYGHSCLQVTHNDLSIIIDPLITRNPCTKRKQEDVKADYVLLSHGHHDHFGDTLEIASRNDALVIAPYELGLFLRTKGLKTHPMGIGGRRDFGGWSVELTYARHSSSYQDPVTQEIVYTGPACGFLLRIGGKTIYFAGDTALFYEMKRIGEQNEIDVAYLPIGGNYTMGPEDALQAAEWLKADRTVPIHYNSFPFLDQDPELFVRRLEEKGLKGYVQKPDEILRL